MAYLYILGNFFLLQKIQTGCGAHSTSYSVDTRAFLLLSVAGMAKADYSPAKVKND
jgi:hypothetical protein